MICQLQQAIDIRAECARLPTSMGRGSVSGAVMDIKDTKWLASSPSANLRRQVLCLASWFNTKNDRT